MFLQSGESLLLKVVKFCQPLQIKQKLLQKKLLSKSKSIETINTFNLDNSRYLLTNQIENRMDQVLPFFACGEIIRGFGRGSKELGMPTANFPPKVVRTLPEDLGTGVYYGWASVNHGEVYKMVMSIGWNPFYQNEEKSMETHILHNYNKDLYGHLLKVCIVGYLRPEKNFKSLDDLIAAIKQDIEQAKECLEKPDAFKLKDSTFFKDGMENPPGNSKETPVKVNGEKI